MGLVRRTARDDVLHPVVGKRNVTVMTVSTVAVMASMLAAQGASLKSTPIAAACESSAAVFSASSILLNRLARAG